MKGLRTVIFLNSLDAMWKGISGTTYEWGGIKTAAELNGIIIEIALVIAQQCFPTWPSGTALSVWQYIAAF